MGQTNGGAPKGGLGRAPCPRPRSRGRGKGGRRLPSSIRPRLPCVAPLPPPQGPSPAPPSAAGLSSRGNKKHFVTPTETKVHGGALCFVVMGPSLLRRLAVGGWRLAVGGGWWRLAAVGRWRLVVPWGLSLRAALSQKTTWLLQDSPARPPLPPTHRRGPRRRPPAPPQRAARQQEPAADGGGGGPAPLRALAHFLRLGHGPGARGVQRPQRHLFAAVVRRGGGGGPLTAAALRRGGGGGSSCAVGGDRRGEAQAQTQAETQRRTDERTQTQADGSRYTTLTSGRLRYTVCAGLPLTH